MSSRGKPAQALSSYRIATVRHFAADAGASRIGRVSTVDNRGLLRDALVAQAKEHGFAA